MGKRTFCRLIRWFFLLAVASSPFTLHPSPVFSEEDLTVSAQVSKTEVKPDETLVYSITIAGSLRGTPKLRMASFEGFKVVSTGQSQQIQIKEGKTRRAVVLNYALVPAAPGSYRLGPVTVEVGGQEYQTEEIEVEVVEPDLSEELPKLEGEITL